MVVKKPHVEFRPPEVQPDIAEAFMQELGRRSVEIGVVNGIAPAPGGDLINAVPVDVLQQVVVSGTVEVWGRGADEATLQPVHAPVAPLRDEGTVPEHQPPRTGARVLDRPEGADRAGGVDPQQLHGTGPEGIVDIGHDPAFAVVGVLHLRPPVAPQIMVAQNRVKRQIVRLDVLEFAAKLRVLDSGNPVLDKIVAE